MRNTGQRFWRRRIPCDGSPQQETQKGGEWGGDCEFLIQDPQPAKSPGLAAGAGKSQSDGY
jgi:hypothetical protein